MSQEYSNPSREPLPHALPDVEVFEVVDGDLCDENGEALESGWYWWSCFPGCLPDGDPHGPFKTEKEARRDSQSDWREESDE